MRMIKLLYKRIIRKLNLSVNQLKELKDKLALENICKGPFVQGEKNCPNTTALAIKEGRGRFQESSEVKKLLKQRGVNNIELWTFYLLFDMPALISERFFKKALSSMRTVVNELIQEKQR